MWTSTNKKIYVFLSIILLIGLISGIIFVIMLSESSKEIIFLNINEMIQNFGNIKINNILTHLIIISVISLLSIFVIGAPLLIFFTFYNGFSAGFVISSITAIFGLKGLLYGLIYILVSQLIFIILFTILSTSLLKIIKIITKRLLNKSSRKENIIVLIKKVLLCNGLILISDVIIYFGGSKLINLFNFLLN